jgi:Trk K+ transport system NAD-binding subunit
MRGPTSEPGIQDVDVALVSIGENIESSLLVVMQLRELGIQAIVAKAVTPLHGSAAISVVPSMSWRLPAT